MPDIYVSGPVLRPQFDHPVQNWVQQTYREILESAAPLGLKVRHPQLEYDLERASPSRFFETIRERISDSRIAVVVFTGGDVSSGIEAALASAMENPCW